MGDSLLLHMWYTFGMTRLTVTLSIALAAAMLLPSCSTLDPQDFSVLRSPTYETTQEPTIEETYADSIVLLAPLVEEVSPYIEEMPSEPSIEPIDEIPQPTMDEVLEAILAPSEEIPDPIEFPSLPEPSTDITLPPPSSTVRIGANELPMWFCYTSAGLFLASLFTICYIAKQRKESTWHRFRD